MIRVTCSCGKRFRGPEAARGRAIKCTGCGASITVPADAPVDADRSAPVSAAQAMASEAGAEAERRGSFGELWAALRRRALHLDFIPPKEHLRRCMRCSLTTFAVPEPCPGCGSATVGIRLSDVNSGRDRQWLIAVGAIGAARRRLSLFRRIAFLVLALGAVGAGIALGYSGALSPGRGLLIASAALLALAFVSFFAHFFTCRALEVLHPVLRDRPGSEPADERLTAQVEERFLIPFIQRHAMYRETCDLIPPEELDMLVTLVGRNGFSLRRENIYAFLAACGLRADYQEFKGEFLRFELSNPDTFQVYAALFPSGDADVTRMPFLQQYLEEGSRRPERAALKARVEVIRREKKLATFEAELEKHSSVPATARTVKVDDVDRIAPENFQLLVGLMLQSQGSVVHGMPATVDRPAMSVAEKGGERTAVLARLSREALGEGAVKDLVEARDYYRCHQALLVANADFTPATVKAAGERGVKLADRRALEAMISAFNVAPREFARLTLILKPWQPAKGEEVMTYDEVDEVLAQLQKKSKEREEEERKAKGSPAP